MDIVKLKFLKTILFIFCLNIYKPLTHSIKINNDYNGGKHIGLVKKRLFFIRNPKFKHILNGFSDNYGYINFDDGDSFDNLESINSFTLSKAKNKFNDENGGFVDYYKILSLDKSCSREELETKYRDLNDSLMSLPGVDPNLRTEVDKAYEVLSNDSMRNEYDKYYNKFYNRSRNNDDMYYNDSSEDSMMDHLDEDGSEEIEISIINDDETPDLNLNNNIFGNFFSNLFGMGGGRPDRKKVQRTKPNSRFDLSCNAEIDLKTLLLGGSVSVTVRKWDDCNFCNFNESALESYIDKCDRCKGQGMEHKEKRSPTGFFRASRTCTKCQGTGYNRLKDCTKCENTGRVLRDSVVKVDVPFNAKVGSVIKVKGKGHSGGFDMPNGDLYVRLKMKETKNEYIEGGRIVTVYNLPYTKAILGQKVKVPTFIGDKEVSIPPYSQQGDEIKVGAYKNMEHYVKLNVQLPTNLSKDELDLLNKIDKR